MSLHTRNLQRLVTEMFNLKIGESPSITHEMFQIDESNNYNLRKNSRFKSGNPKIVKQLWIISPEDYKNSTSLKEFKAKIKNWVPLNCSCHLGKIYIKNVGFI